MVQLRDKRLWIDGRPVLVFCGEIHYFRLDKSDWEDRIRKLKELGCNAVASYIPWIVHQEVENELDVSQVGEFIDLCHRHGLWFIARPGPFVMAEMKNEGIPFWVYDKHPEAVPVTWNGEKGRSKTLDYLAPGYLEEVDRWYAAVMPVLASRLQDRGGPVIAVQLDNEVGMLSWVNNQPDLNENVLCDFASWLATKYTAQKLKQRYPFDVYDPAPRVRGFRDPKPEYAAAFMADYGDYNRNRIARYFAHLRHAAESHGVKGVPFVVNIHGSGGGRGTQFPIGIHHLFEAYGQDSGYLPGTDHYLGNLTRENAPDLYFINAFTAATARPEQPISSMEFEVGSGDYGETGAVRMPASAADLKVRLSVAQGNRLINYYLLAGGHNPKLRHERNDGNDRIAITGERHGFAAPISPEGELDPTYHALKATTEAMLAIADKLADMDEEHDPVALGFIPDYYKTDFHLPGPMEHIVQSLEMARGPLVDLVRTMLALGFRFPAIDLQHRPIRTSVLALASAAAMPEDVQRKLASFVSGGGKLLLVGDVPTMDIEGRPCTVLADALGVRVLGVRQDSDRLYLSVRGLGWAASEPEVRTWRAQALDAPGGLLSFADNAQLCAAELPGATVLTCNYPSHLGFFRKLFARRGAIPALAHDDRWGGVLMQSMSNRQGERFLSLINLDDEPKNLLISERGKALFDGRRVSLAGRKAKMLPLGVRFGAATIASSTAEVRRVTDRSIDFAPTAAEEVVLLRVAGAKPTVAGGRITESEGQYRIKIPAGATTARVEW